MWETYALGTAFAWAIATILDKILLQGRLPSRNAYLILQSAVGILPILGLLAAGRLPSGGEPEVLALAVLSGVLESAFILGYYRALQTADASVVAILLQGVPVITVAISSIAFREVFTATTYAGIAIIVAGTVLATMASSPGRMHVGLRVIATVLPALLAVSISYSLQSYTLRTITVDTLFVAGRIGQLLVAAAMLCWAPVRREFATTTAGLNGRVTAIVILVGMLNLSGIYLLNEAYARGPLALVTTLSSVQPILVLGLILVVNAIRPQTVPDEGSRAFLGPRAVATALVIAGIFLSAS